MTSFEAAEHLAGHLSRADVSGWRLQARHGILRLEHQSGRIYDLPVDGTTRLADLCSLVDECIREVRHAR